jgi:hypothetical protein
MGGVGASTVPVAAAELETKTTAQQPAAKTVHKRIRKAGFIRGSFAIAVIVYRLETNSRIVTLLQK